MRHVLLCAAFMVLMTSLQAQHREVRSHLSIGHRSGPIGVPEQIGTVKGESKRRPHVEYGHSIGDDWLFGVGFSRNTVHGGLWSLDSTWVVFDLSGIGPATDPFGLSVWSEVLNAPRTKYYKGDAVFIANTMTALDLTVARVIKPDHRERFVHVSHRLAAGLRLMHVHEEHSYGADLITGDPGNLRRNSAYPTFSTNTMGAAFLLQLRSDLHFTAFFSLFASLDVQQDLGTRLPGTDPMDPRHGMAVRQRAAKATGASLGIGCAVHF